MADDTYDSAALADERATVEQLVTQAVFDGLANTMVVANARQFAAIFTREPDELSGVVNASQPVMDAPSAQVDAAALKHGDLITVGGQPYLVREVLAADAGITRVHLADPD